MVFLLLSFLTFGKSQSKLISSLLVEYYIDKLVLWDPLNHLQGANSREITSSTQTVLSALPATKSPICTYGVLFLSIRRRVLQVSAPPKWFTVSVSVTSHNYILSLLQRRSCCPYSLFVNWFVCKQDEAKTTRLTFMKLVMMTFSFTYKELLYIFMDLFKKKIFIVYFQWWHLLMFKIPIMF